MKLELKHIAPYLPYELKLKRFDGKISELEIYSIPTALLVNFKPILRPLSEIGKFEDIVDEFSEYSWEAFSNHFFDTVLGRSLNCFDNVNYTVVELCFKHHLDIFGLIEQNLAIDINTLEK